MYTYKSREDTVVMLDSHEKKGLTQAEAIRRLEQQGENRLEEPPGKSLPAAFIEQLNDPLIYILLAAAAISLFLHEVSDAVIILVVVLLNAVVGLIQEGKAQRALDALKQLTSPKAYVIRDGREQEIPAAKLVPGDIVCLETGAQVPADLRLLTSHNLKIEESALTGESMPIEKQAQFQPEAGIPMGASVELPLGDRRNMAYMSTIVTYGRGTGIVTATGMDTEIGKIATLINNSSQDLTPLQKRLGDLGKMLTLLSLSLCVLLFFLALIQKRDIFEMLLTAISLAVAAVPEGLPAVVTICLALSVTRMARVHTIIRRLPSVETLGAVNVVCSDKTGTLTQNRMEVMCCYQGERFYARNQMTLEENRQLLTGFTLCNDGVLSYQEVIGDPTEIALLQMAEGFGLHRQELEQQQPRSQELAFDSKRKMMSTYHVGPGGAVAYTKGAPEEVLKCCTRVVWQGECIPVTARIRQEIRQQMEQMSSKALRTLALAMKQGGDGPVEEDLIFLGMVGMKDPARPEAAAAVEEFRRAGVRTVMITGDHQDTALAIAAQLGIATQPEECLTGAEIQQLDQEEWNRRLPYIRVFARVSPEHKVKIVRGLQQQGNIVAMTGDGVNDAPSLKAADVGIAMGQGGTDVARQAADMILTDDNFATIEKAIEEGRGVYENIKKSVIFLLSSNLGEILTMFLAVLFGLAAPLRSSHILWINLITDSLPALALGMDDNDGTQLMAQPPRKPQENLFAGGGLACTCFYGILIAAISLTAFLMKPYGLLDQAGLDFTLEHVRRLLEQPELLRECQTYAFTVLGMSQLFHAIGMRDIRRSVFAMGRHRNGLMLLAGGLGLALQLAVTRIPALIGAFGTVELGAGQWIRLGILAVFPLLAHEIMAFLYQRSSRKS